MGASHDLWGLCPAPPAGQGGTDRHCRRQDTILARVPDGQTDRRTDGHGTMASGVYMASECALSVGMMAPAAAAAATMSDVN